LLFISAALLLEGESLWSAALAGVCGALATLTKQPGLVLMGLAGLHTVLVKAALWSRGGFRPRLLVFHCGIPLLTGDLLNPAVLFLDVQGGRQSSAPVGQFPARSALPGGVIPFMVLFTAAALVLRFRFSSEKLHPRQPTGRSGRGHWCLGCGRCSRSSSRPSRCQHQLLHAFACVGALALAEGAQWMARRGFDGRRIASLAALAQLAMLIYNPTLFLPTAEAAKEAGRLVETLKQVDGPIWFPAFLPMRAGWKTLGRTLWNADRSRRDQSGHLAATSPARSGIAGSVCHLASQRPLGEHDELRQFYEERPFPEINSPFLRRTFNIEFGAIFIRKPLTPS